MWVTNKQIQMEWDGELDSEGQVGVSWVVQGATVNILRCRPPVPNRIGEQIKEQQHQRECQYKNWKQM